jgi:hypothetical protein
MPQQRRESGGFGHGPSWAKRRSQVESRPTDEHPKFYVLTTLASSCLVLSQ